MRRPQNSDDELPLEEGWISVLDRQAPTGVDVLYWDGVHRFIGKRHIDEKGTLAYCERIGRHHEFKYAPVLREVECWSRMLAAPRS